MNINKILKDKQLSERTNLLKAFGSPVIDLKKAEEGDGKQHWITVRGKHVLIGGDGEIKAGNIGQGEKGVSGKSMKKVSDTSKSEDKKPGYHDEKPDLEFIMHNESEEIAKGSGISHDKYKELHPETKKFLTAQHLKNKKSDTDEGVGGNNSNWNEEQAAAYAEGWDPNDEGDMANYRESNKTISGGSKTDNEGGRASVEQVESEIHSKYQELIGKGHDHETAVDKTVQFFDKSYSPDIDDVEEIINNLKDKSQSKQGS